MVLGVPVVFGPHDAGSSESCNTVTDFASWYRTHMDGTYGSDFYYRYFGRTNRYPVDTSYHFRMGPEQTPEPVRYLGTVGNRNQCAYRRYGRYVGYRYTYRYVPLCPCQGRYRYLHAPSRAQNVTVSAGSSSKFTWVLAGSFHNELYDVVRDQIHAFPHSAVSTSADTHSRFVVESTCYQVRATLIM